MNENTNWGETPENITNNDISDNTPLNPDKFPDSFPHDEEIDKSFTYGVFENADVEEKEVAEYCCKNHCHSENCGESHPSGEDDFASPRTLDLTPYSQGKPEPQQNCNPAPPQPGGYYVNPQTPQPTYTPQTPSYQPPVYQQPNYIPQGAVYQAPAPQNAPQYYTQPQYNPQPNPAYAAPQPSPKKKSTGAKVMLICLWVLLGLFSVAIVGVVGYYLNDKGLSLPGFSYEDIFGEDFTLPAAPDDEDDHNVIIPDNNDDENDTPEDEDNELYDSNAVITLNDYPADRDDITKYNTKTAFEKVSPSTVGIMCYADKDRTTLSGQGTGIIIDKNGYIATNSHVIGDSKAYYISVVLDNGDSYNASVVGYDTRTDLAVIKISASSLIPAEFADSEQASIGEEVIAVGNPGGMEFQNTLTRGVISAKDRTLGLSTQVSYIQTDAAINPGNSGGPLCNAYGQVIGINSAKIADADYEGMGFAIPSTTVKEVVDDLVKQGYVEGRVKIGITGTVTTQSYLYSDIPTGIQIAEIIEGGPCDNGEIKTGDIICQLDDYKIQSFNDIYVALTNYKAGDKATLKIYSTSTGEYYESEIILQADNGSATVE